MSDDEIVYTKDLDGVTPERLAGFFVDWPDPPTPARHLDPLAGSRHRWLAIDGQNGPVVGFVTAVSHGVLTAFIPLLEVLPRYRGRDIGSHLMELILEELDGLYGVDLMCDPELQPFYRRFGMRPGVGMSIRRYDQQSGS